MPQTHGVEPHLLPQPGFGERLADQLRARDRLRDQEIVKVTDNAGPAVAAGDPAGHRLTEHAGQLQHPRAAGHRQDIDGRIGGGRGHDRHLRCGFTNGERDVGVGGVGAGGGHERGLIGAGLAPRLGIIEWPGHHAVAGVDEGPGLGHIVGHDPGLDAG